MPENSSQGDNNEDLPELDGEDIVFLDDDEVDALEEAMLAEEAEDNDFETVGESEVNEGSMFVDGDILGV
jgi:hypothetical protein